MNVQAEYRSKLRTPEEAVKVVKSGDWVDYGTNVGFPTLLDAALAKRRDELTDVKLRGNLLFGPIQTVECDPTREHFLYNSWHCSAYERKLCDKGLCNYIPMIFRNVVPYYRHFLTVNVAMLGVTPMDRHGYFNFSCSTGVARGIMEKADIVILEVNEHLPRTLGGFGECVHISEVDYVVEGEHAPLPQFPVAKPTEEDVKIAEIIVPQIPSGATLQLGIGGMPNVVGSLLAQSDLKDLGMHTELCGDAYYQLYEAGKLTNRCKTLHQGKGVTGIVFGSKDLYEWVDDNPGLMVAPLEYVNAPETIAQLDNMISINSCIAAGPLRSGLRRERWSAPHQRHRRPAGLSHRRGHVPGRQSLHLHDLLLCGQGRCPPLPHPAPLRRGHHHRSRSQAYYLVTEYGAVNLAGRSTWERAEMLVSIAHPDFREELIAAADAQKIWRRSNKR